MLLVVLIWGVNFSVTKGAFDSVPAARVHRGALRARESPPGPAGAIGWRARSRCRAGRWPGSSCSGWWATPSTSSAFISGSGADHGVEQRAHPGLDAHRSWRCWPSCSASSRSAPRCSAECWSRRLGVVLVVAARGDRLRRSAPWPAICSRSRAVICWAGYTLGLRSVPQGVSPLRVTMVTTIAGAPGAAARRLARDRWGWTGARWAGRAGRRWPTRRCSRCWWPT